jgi:hypothetical protein
MTWGKIAKRFDKLNHDTALHEEGSVCLNLNSFCVAWIKRSDMAAIMTGRKNEGAHDALVTEAGRGLE